MKSNHTILGLVTGLAIGAAIGVLIAPDKGKKTRKKIVSKTKHAKDKLTESLDHFLDAVSEKYEGLKSEGEELLNQKKEDLKENIKKA
jgi:gas vesicle protein